MVAHKDRDTLCDEQHRKKDSSWRTTTDEALRTTLHRSGRLHHNRKRSHGLARHHLTLQEQGFPVSAGKAKPISYEMGSFYLYKISFICRRADEISCSRSESSDTCTNTGHQSAWSSLLPSPSWAVFPFRFVRRESFSNIVEVRLIKNTSPECVSGCVHVVIQKLYHILLNQ